MSLWKKLFGFQKPESTDFAKIRPGKSSVARNPPEPRRFAASPDHCTGPSESQQLSHNKEPIAKKTEYAAKVADETITMADVKRLENRLNQDFVSKMTFATNAKGITRQFSASRKLSSRDAWFDRDAYCLLEFNEWVCLLSATDRSFEPNADLYYAALLLKADPPADIIEPLHVRFFLDRMLGPEDEHRGKHVLTALGSMWPARLPDIAGLSIDHFKLGDLAPVATFKELKALSIAGCRGISDWTPLGQLKSLEVLRLDLTTISDLSFVTMLPCLRILSLVGCKKVTNDSIRCIAQAYASGSLGGLTTIHLRGAGVSGIDKDVLEGGSPSDIFNLVQR